MTAGEDIAIRRKRLRYRAWHRGTKEMDLVLGPFCDANIEGYDTATLDRLEALMNDADIRAFVDWLATKPAGFKPKSPGRKRR